MAGKPEPPAEAALIKRVREARRLTIPDVATRAGMSPSRWSQIENGYERKSGAYVSVRAPSATLAHMASVLDVRAEQLVEAGRSDALDVLGEITRVAAPVSPRSTAEGGDGVGSLIESLATAAQDAGKPIGELLLDYGIDPRELVIPDAPPDDPEIAELIALGLPPEMTQKLIRINLENRARRWEEAREARRKQRGEK